MHYADYYTFSMSTDPLSSSEDLRVFGQTISGQDREEYTLRHDLRPNTEHPQDSDKVDNDAPASHSTHGVDTPLPKPLEDQMLERLIHMLSDLRHERQAGGNPNLQTRTNPNPDLRIDMGRSTLPSRKAQESFKPTFFGMTKQPLAVPQYHQGKLFPALQTRPLFNIL